MARPIKCRKICFTPLMKGFKPYGMHSCITEAVFLTFEEYESIRLVSYEHLSQIEAAELMNVSRPTLTRVYNKSINKISEALIEGKTIKIEGGNYELDADWHRCKNCNKLVKGLDSQTIYDNSQDNDNNKFNPTYTKTKS